MALTRETKRFIRWDEPFLFAEITPSFIGKLFGVKPYIERFHVVGMHVSRQSSGWDIVDFTTYMWVCQQIRREIQEKL